MKVFERYFKRNPLIGQLVFTGEVRGIVIIPILDDPDIFRTIASLYTCRLSRGKAGVILVVNHGENCDMRIKEANRILAERLRKEVRNSDILEFQVVEAFDLPAKDAGVGLARKIAMDLAAAFFYRIAAPNAPILSLDADTLVDVGYLEQTIRFFEENRVAGVSIAYAHRLEECRGPERTAMIKYELYLRYYRLALAYAGHPYAYSCIGSAFAVRAVDYVAQGGMNKRQAGEDFYFLQKLIGTGRYALLSATRVYPSPRFSARTPFGTGRSVRQIVESEGYFPVYRLEAFQSLKTFFEGVAGLYKADDRKVEGYIKSQSSGLQNFLTRIDGISMIAEANANCASCQQFIKRFFDHFNAFRVLKYLNYIHENQYSKMDVADESYQLFQVMGYPWADNLMENLEFLRNVPEENLSLY